MTVRDCLRSGVRLRLGVDSRLGDKCLPMRRHDSDWDTTYLLDLLRSRTVRFKVRKFRAFHILYFTLLEREVYIYYRG